jgi:hypothetical protein
MAFNMSIENAIRWSDESANLIGGLEFTNVDNRIKVSSSLLDLSIEHNRGIIILINSATADAAAFALLRPQIDAFLRGVWYGRCATGEKIESFVSRKDDPPKNHILISAIQQLPDFKNGDLKKSIDEIKSHLNDYTHGGTTQMKARFSNGEIGSSFTPEHREWLVNTSSCYLLLAGVALAALAKNDILVHNLGTAYHELYPSIP